MSRSARRFKPPVRSSAKRAGILEAVKLPSVDRIKEKVAEWNASVTCKTA
jgi:hypothetical protein